MHLASFLRKPARTAAAAILAGLFFSSAGAGESPGAPAAGPSADYTVPPVRLVDGVQQVEQGGVRVSLAVQHLGDASKSVVAGEEALVQLQVLDAGSGAPLRGARPAAWLARRAAGQGPSTSGECLEMIRRYAAGGLSATADVDLNQFYVFALNRDRSITVINPLVSFSRTKLLGIMTLPAPGRDWALLPSRAELLVTMPDRGSIARIDTRRRRIEGEIHLEGRPGGLVVLDAQETLWVGDESDGAVTVVDGRTGAPSARLSAGRGPVLLAAAKDGSKVFVAALDRLSILDARKPAVVHSVELVEAPSAMAVSDLSGAIYLASSGSGRLAVHDAETGVLRTEIALKAGLSAVAVTPDGRWVLAANGAEDTVDVLDAATGLSTRTFDVEPGPDRIFFSSAFAYVRSRDSSNVTLIQWTALGSPGSLPVVMIPMGQSPPGEPAGAVAAASLEQVPGGGAVIAASRADKMLYYYSEGMMAPMGSFQNTSREPLAVKIVDGSLREKAPGLYATEVTLEEGGLYDLPFLLESPRIAGCFEVTVAEAPGAARRRSGPMVRAAFVPPPDAIEAGRSTRIAFRLTDPDTGRPLTGLKDVRILAFQPPGGFQARLPARETAAEGTYEAAITYPEPGVYFVLPACPSRGVEWGDLPHTEVVAVPSAPSSTVDERAGRPAAAGEGRP